ncbi:autotransporter outer membrane beta-barrel domain-containing protein [Escherichia coli]|nr:autotransporter outer membrane beta-barrel domain-containing protein [Escherichia coli]
MNKIYSLRKNDRDELVVAPETAGCRKRGMRKGCSGKSYYRRLLLAMLMAGVFSSLAEASVVGTLLPWQTYRDFAENKGAFYVGAVNVPLYDKDGGLSGYLDRAPMVDFSAVDQQLGVATLVSPQYVVGVKHNGSYTTVRFGYGDDTEYRIVDRNEHWRDFHTPRLNKVVTEVIPVLLPEDGTRQGVWKDRLRYPVFYRTGSGTQYIATPSGKLTQISGAYVWKTGGTVGSPGISDWSIVSDAGNLYQSENGPLASYGVPGDSGSPLFAWDALKGQWVLAAVLHGYDAVNGKTNWFTVVPYGDVLNTMKQDDSASVLPVSAAGDIRWSQSGTNGAGQLKQGSSVWSTSGYSNGELNNGKDISFEGHGTVVLDSDIEQGAGSLTFNGDYTFMPASAQTWVGGGVIVNDDHSVNWKVGGRKGDALHKIGTGTLIVSGSGINEGALNTGDGTVILAQMPDENGRVQSFSSVTIVSGRPVVVLQDAHQVNPDNIRWGWRGGTLDVNGNDIAFGHLAAADNGAVLTSSTLPATVSLDFSHSGQAAEIWHGRFTGNLNITNEGGPDFVMDGGADISGSLTQQGGSLYMQGHPVVHAVTAENVAALLRQTGDTSVLTQPVSFSQSDWEHRLFRMHNLVLNDAEFRLSRNAVLESSIQANQSALFVGSDSIYLDMNDGAGSNVVPVKGVSVPEGEEEAGIFRGQVSLQDSALNVAGHFTGNVAASDSRITLASGKMILDGDSQLSGTPLEVKDGGVLQVRGRLQSDTPVMVTDATLQLGTQGEGIIRNALSTVPEDMMSAVLFQGSVEGKNSELRMYNAGWLMNGNSAVSRMNVAGSVLQFSEGSKFNELTVGRLDINGSTVVMRSGQGGTDHLRVTESLTGQNNLLLVDFMYPPSGEDALNIPLITAPAGTKEDIFSVETRNIGFSHVTPVVRRESDGSGVRWSADVKGEEESRGDASPDDAVTQWFLSGYQSTLNESAVRAAARVMSVGYRTFLNELNNLNKRMGDLRDINGEAGAWARIMSGAGSAGGGYSDNYTHVQIGADKKHELDGLDLFTGVTMTYTDSHAGSHDFSGETKSVGAGLYASALFESGAYIDLIGKYVHHDNEYTATFAGLGTKDYSSHSWYAGAEVGYRYHVTGDAWVEPQAELVYGAVSGTQFSWKDQGMNVSMASKDSNPLIGRTGVDVGKSFSGKDWKVTARAGIGYQFDLLANGETVLRDASGEKRIKGEKDGRMLMNVGLNAEIRDNIRFGLEFEKSASGKYNVDNAVNANFRYSF